MIHILFFGQLADIATQELGSSEFKHALATGQDTIALSELRQLISKDSTQLHQELQKSSNLCAVNQAICHTDITIQPGDEVAFMSPMSGG